MKNAFRQLLERAQQTPKIFYYLLFCLFILSRASERIYWEKALRPYVKAIRADFRVMMLFAALICVALLLEKPHADGRVTGSEVFLTGAAALLAYLILRSGKQYDSLITICLIAGALGQDLRSMMKCILVIFTGTLAVGTAGCRLGFTIDRVKSQPYGEGSSLGMSHANSFSLLFVMILLLIWCLYLHEKKVIYTFLFFWLTAIPVYAISKCRTGAVLMTLFPVSALLFPFLKKMKDGIRKRVLCVLLAAAPFLCWMLTFFLAGQMNFLQRAVGGRPFYNLFVRFIQAGIAVSHYGFSAFPQEIALDGSITANLSGYVAELTILDNAYAYYSLTWGLLLMGVALLWLTLANIRAVKEQEYALLAAGLFICLYGFMERVPLKLEFNFMFFYPMTMSFGRRMRT